MKKPLSGLFWFAGTTFVLLVAFALLKPFLWYWIFKEPPTEITNTFSSLLTILIALLALGLGVFGASTFYAIRDRIHQETKEAAKQEYIVTIVRLNSNICHLAGCLYEILIRIIKKKDDRYWTEGLIGLSASSGSIALEYVKELDKKVHQKLIAGVMNNYAMALALEGYLQNTKTAKEIIFYLENEIKEYPEDEKIRGEETINFLRWRIPIKKNDCSLARKKLDEILRSTLYKDDPRGKFIKERWDIYFPKPKGFT